MVCWLFFNFALLFDFGCCSLTQKMNFVDCYLPYFRQWLITSMLSTLLPFQSMFTETLPRDQLLPPPSFSSVLTAHHPLCCVLVFSSLFIVQFFLLCFFFLHEGGISLPRGLCWFIPEVAGGIPCDTWCSPVDLPNVTQAGLEPASDDMGTLLFSQCNVACRSFPWTRGSGCQSFDSSWCFISTKCGSSVSAIFLIYGAHAVCFCALVNILDLSW
jgi:hypothetical protein